MEGRHLVQLPHQILQYIKSLGVTFYSLYHKDLDILADSIPHLPCLTSLDISYNPIGDGNTVKLLRALRQHGKLKLPDHAP